MDQNSNLNRELSLLTNPLCHLVSTINKTNGKNIELAVEENLSGHVREEHWFYLVYKLIRARLMKPETFEFDIENNADVVGVGKVLNVFVVYPHKVYTTSIYQEGDWKNIFINFLKTFTYYSLKIKN
jgi:hypothetical protein